MNSLDGLEQWQNNGGEMKAEMERAMTKGQQFAEWYWRMDWEGGVSDLVQKGEYDSGDDKLDAMLDELDSLLTRINERINVLEEKYKNEVHGES